MKKSSTVAPVIDNIKLNELSYVFFENMPALNMLDDIPFEMNNLLKPMMEVITFNYHTDYLFMIHKRSIFYKGGIICFIPSFVADYEFSMYYNLRSLILFFNLYDSKFADQIEELKDKVLMEKNKSYQIVYKEIGFIQQNC